MGDADDATRLTSPPSPRVSPSASTADPAEVAKVDENRTAEETLKLNPTMATHKNYGLAGFLLLHCYTQLVLCPAHIVYTVLTGRANPFALTRHLCERMNVEFRLSKTSHERCDASSRRVIYMCNHRSWADFFVDQAVTGGSAYLARYMVWIGTPVSSLYAWLTHSTWFFNRKKGIDRQWFAKFMDDEWNKRPSYGMIAYPEGTRNQNFEPLALKTGVIQYAYEYKRVVQCVVTTNKEKVCNEKSFYCSTGRTVVTSFGEIIDPVDYPTLPEFVAKVRESYVATWRDAYAANVEEAKVYEPPSGTGLSAPVYEPVCEPAKLHFLRVVLFLVVVALVARSRWG